MGAARRHVPLSPLSLRRLTQTTEGSTPHGFILGLSLGDIFMLVAWAGGEKSGTGRPVAQTSGWPCLPCCSLAGGRRDKCA